MVKSIILALVSNIIISCNYQDTQQSNDQGLNNVDQIDTMQLVTRINQYVENIDSRKDSLKYHKRDIFKSAEGGLVETFSDKSDTLKKEIVYYGETGKRIVNIYFEEGQPVFVLDSILSYTEPINIERAIEVSGIKTKSFYLDKDEVFYCLVDGNKISIEQIEIESQNIPLDE